VEIQEAREALVVLLHLIHQQHLHLMVEQEQEAALTVFLVLEELTVQDMVLAVEVEVMAMAQILE
jgi:hypothetical protein